jgi:hypothetical protein
MDEEPTDKPTEGKGAKGRFLKNNKLAKGGLRNPPGGRPLDRFKAKCRAVIDRNDLVEMCGDIASGRKGDPILISDGKDQPDGRPKFIQSPPKARDRVLAYQELRTMGYGNPTQNVAITTTINVVTIEDVIAAIKQRLPTCCPACKTNLNMRTDISNALMVLSARIKEQTPRDA